MGGEIKRNHQQGVRHEKLNKKESMEAGCAWYYVGKKKMKLVKLLHNYYLLKKYIRACTRRKKKKKTACGVEVRFYPYTKLGINCCNT